MAGVAFARDAWWRVVGRREDARVERGGILPCGLLPCAAMLMIFRPYIHSTGVSDRQRRNQRTSRTVAAGVSLFLETRRDT